jgi:diguanylate cyclase (GGDEF)-like protein
MKTIDEHDLTSAMLRDRYRLLTRQVPTLYVIVLVCTVPIIGLILSRGGGAMAIAPAAIATVAFARMRVWRRARHDADAMSVEAIRKRLRLTAIIGPSLGFALACAVVACGLLLDPYAQVVTLATVWMCTIASAFCLSTLPSAAYGVVFSSGAPLCAFLLYMGEPVLLISGGLVGALACLVIYVIKQTHDAFAEILRARRVAEQNHEIAAQANVEASRLANSDCLTQLPNRRHFMTQVAERTRRVEGSFAVALIDLDGFKPVNDVYGHAAGDAVLIEVGRRLAALTAGGGLAARFGGDEFCLMLEPACDAAHAVAAARAARDAIAEPIEAEPQLWVRVDCCIGVAMRDGAVGAGDLMERADETLYRCKKLGRGGVDVWAPCVEADLGFEPATVRAA